MGQIDFTQSSFIEEMTVVAFQAWIAERKTAKWILILTNIIYKKCRKVYEQSKMLLHLFI